MLKDVPLPPLETLTPRARSYANPLLTEAAKAAIKRGSRSGREQSGHRAGRARRCGAGPDGARRSGAAPPWNR